MLFVLKFNRRNQISSKSVEMCHKYICFGVPDNNNKSNMLK